MPDRTLTATQRVLKFLVNLMAGLAAYTYLPTKPSRLHLPERLACSASCRFLVCRTHVVLAKQVMTGVNQEYFLSLAKSPRGD